MKKVLFIFLLLLSYYGFTQTKSLEIQSVKGIVKFKNENDVWERVTKDTDLKYTTYIKTGLNSSIVLVLDDKSVVRIKSIKRGFISKLLQNNSNHETIIISDKKLTESNVNSEDIQQRSNISVASTRADESPDDENDWEEED